MHRHFSLPTAFSLWLSFTSLFTEAGQDVEGNLVLALGNTVPVDTPGTYWTDLHPCPVPCSDLSVDKWTTYSTIERLARCQEPLIFDTAIYTPLEPGELATIRACTVSNHGSSPLLRVTIPSTRTEKPRYPLKARAQCRPESKELHGSTVQYGRSGNSEGVSREGMLAALKAMQTIHERRTDNCDRSILFSYANGTVAALYIGNAFEKTPTIGSLIDRLTSEVKAAEPAPAKMLAQLCGKGRNSQHVLGLAINTRTTGNPFTFVQDALVSWYEARCVEDSTLMSAQVQGPLRIMESEFVLNNNNGTLANTTTAGNNSSSLQQTQPLDKRADCRTEIVYGGDLCPALAQRCNIGLTALNSFNKNKKDFCNTLQIGQRVCCSSGSLPDIRPEPEVKGECRSIVIQGGETCAVLSAKYNIDKEDIEKWNNKSNSYPGTWGWLGCGKVMAGTKICLSEGDPPMPASITNAQCGPMVPGSKRPSAGTALADINPCPLNACCNIHGQCGINQDFCTEKPAKNGNPGTSSGTNGCVSSCGMELANDGEGPSEYGRVGYYESWNFGRKCLNMRATDANTDGSYTIIHWAFAEINMNDFTVKIVDEHNQWAKFRDLRNVKKVISFGGWAFSNEGNTYNDLRLAMDPANRAKFAKNVVDFLEDKGLDGADFDWEYPGADDIPGTPAGSASDGPNYLKFLETIRKVISDRGAKLSLSIAAPASFWYLKQFPIKRMAQPLDYIVYMTYDLHVTKAGVPTKKIFVGESSYGRSFKMAEAGCDGADCFFLGDKTNSPAKKGPCTDTGGYISNAEIQDIIAQGGDSNKWWYDYHSDSAVLAYTDADVTGSEDQWENLPSAKDRPDCKSGPYSKIEDIPADADDYCKDLYILQVLHKDLQASLDTYDDLIDGGYDKKFDSYAKAVAKSGNSAIEKFMYTKGDDYFTCTIVEVYTCCKACPKVNPGNLPNEQYCQYCEDFKCNTEFDCQPENWGCGQVDWRYRNVTGPCPPDYSKRTEKEPDWGHSKYAFSSVYWQVKSENKFYAALFNETGIDQEFIKWENVERHGCPLAPSEDENCFAFHHDYGFPRTHDYDADDIADPKDLVEKARGDMKDLAPSLSTVIDKIEKKKFNGFTRDLVDALSLPVAMIESAVGNMQEIDDIVDDWEEQKRKAIILAFLSAILFFVPIVGEVVGAIAGLANIGRIIAILGAGANTAMEVYNIVDDPANAPLAIFSIILEPLSLLNIDKIARAAQARRSMSKKDVETLGLKKGNKVEAIEDAYGYCKIGSRKRGNVLPFGGMPMTSLRGLSYDVAI
ncbi:hypothetical protein Micbo1qcDRAFT_125215 [Microdochium bolleyi]|uniref:chitinase n=1 Tax=Microdochium bolleyi TaxID=196109 RepID=A0A136IQ37_9PEZI|nr:hypothetical protein Micbo1qcDRAFT_125215 [Microdochium bolleyi]